VPALDTQSLDLGASGFGHAQPIERQQRDQCMLGRLAKACSDQQRAEFVAVQASGVRLIVQTRAPNMSGRRMVEQFFLHGVLEEPGDGAQPARDGRPGAAAGLQVTGEALNVGAAGLEQAHVMLLAPAGELAQVQRVGLAGQAGITGQKTS
jgi:hypothetical protein